MSELAVEVGVRLAQARRNADMTVSRASEELHLGPGWLAAVETGGTDPSVGLLAAAAGVYGVSAGLFLDDIQAAGDWAARSMEAELASGGIKLKFDYGLHPATYVIPDATVESFENWESEFRASLEDTKGRADAVANAFRAALSAWPQSNPAELWAFVVQQIYLDPLAHPAGSIADTGQSWKRAAGWALERVLVDRYDSLLQPYGVSMEMPRKARKQELIDKVRITHGANPDKVDVFLVGDPGGGDTVFGIAHVKASLAERRSDDQPMSERVMEAGMESLFLTLDAKSHPSSNPVCHGEYGDPRPRNLDGQPDPRSDKRKEVEVAGAFSGCFSWNPRTIPTPEWQRRAVKTPIDVVSFHDDESVFLAHVVEAWRNFQRI